jgi:formylglycine-generating enzyme required for sulfatase activity
MYLLDNNPIILNNNKEEELNKESSSSYQEVFISKGVLVFGKAAYSPEDKKKAYSHITTIRRAVDIEPFFIGKSPVTQGEYNIYLTEMGLYTKMIQYIPENEPARTVSWYDAVQYCNWYSKRQGLEECYVIAMDERDPNNKNFTDRLRWKVSCDFSKKGYRLPTEAEWEFAARGGSESKGYEYSGSNCAEDVACFSKAGISNKMVNPSQYNKKEIGYDRRPNELGIYDMTGNCWEWCWDWFEKDFTSLAEEECRLGWAGPTAGRKHVKRGGSSKDDMGRLTLAFRANAPADSKLEQNGFRLVRNAGIKEAKELSEKFALERQRLLKEHKEKIKPIFPEMIILEGGSFRCRKCSFSKYLPEPHHYPGHPVELSGFEIAKYAVTLKEYRNYCLDKGIGTRGYPPLESADCEDCPAWAVSWYDAIGYSNWLSEKAGIDNYYNLDKTRKDPGNLNVDSFDSNSDPKWLVTVNRNSKGYRLPTEAEWEFAALSGNMLEYYPYAGSSSWERVAWFEQYQKSEYEWKKIPIDHPMPVGQLAPNSAGLYDMSGNVWEWCWDWYNYDDHVECDKQARKKDCEPIIDPMGPDKSNNINGSFRVLKGGSYAGYEHHIGASQKAKPHAANTDTGFRLVRSL